MTWRSCRGGRDAPAQRTQTAARSCHSSHRRRPRPVRGWQTARPLEVSDSDAGFTGQIQSAGEGVEGQPVRCAQPASVLGRRMRRLSSHQPEASSLVGFWTIRSPLLRGAGLGARGQSGHAGRIESLLPRGIKQVLTVESVTVFRLRSRLDDVPLRITKAKFTHKFRTWPEQNK